VIRTEFSHIPERISGLVELAFNLWWSWHPEARMLFKMLSRPAWKLSVHNPVRMLHELSGDELEAASRDREFLSLYDAVMERFNADTTEKCGWFFDTVADPECLPIAFFSAEYGLHHSLPFYAGGLGFLAGDILKEASDLGVPLVAMGFMYPGGYLRQKISSDGWQLSESEPVDRENAPISRVLDDRGNRLVVKIPIIEPSIFVEVWKVQVGRVPLYLIDTDIDQNDHWNRGISSRLYVGNPELRIRQEIVLGIGGTEVMNTLGIKHSILHLNEGHPAFALLERIRERVAAGMKFDQAFDEVRSSTVFTTHTPVPAGHDVFPYSLMEKYFGSYWPSLGVDHEGFFKLGTDPKAPASGFNMTAFALRASGCRNGVSKRHGEVSRDMWQSLWPGSSGEQVPIGHVTNGIHVPTWIEPRMELLFNRYLGPDWLSRHDDRNIWEGVSNITDKELWETHRWLKTKLILKILEWSRRKWLEESPEPGNVLASGVFLDPTILTLGFARRFATYKRATLILSDMERLKRMLNDRWRPVQIIFAGKAHPDDDAGKDILRQVFMTARDPSCGGRIAFVEDYDEQLAQYLVHGVDVWLNNPVPPLEACGTSGMKASLNGVPHLSILDGWWVEGFTGNNGWAFEGSGSDRDQAAAIYSILEEKVIPAFYSVNSDGIPHEWTAIMKSAIMKAGSDFSARRMMKEYVSKFYDQALRCLVPRKSPGDDHSEPHEIRS